MTRDFFLCLFFVKRVLKSKKKARLQSQKNKKIKKGRSSVCPREEEDKEEDTKKKTQRRSFGLIFTTNPVHTTQTTHFLYSRSGEDTF
jgi:hypothetical protein